jgi:hypothetical protein
MSQIWKILDEHMEWLKEHGYDEEQLSNGAHPGQFMNTLHRMFSDCIQYALFIKEEQEFTIHATGFFENHRDLVLLTFHYTVDKELTGLNIKKLDATMNGISNLYTVQADWMKEIPNAKEVHQKLKDDLYLQRSRMIESRRPKGKGKSL